ncbi:hypothetical protein ACFLQV_03835 [Calditrichota bacterium]
MKEKYYRLFAPLLIVLVLLWGCEPENPGAPEANQPPETRFTVAPQEGVEHDHYISPTGEFNIQWFGYDPDGNVDGYWISIDGATATYTSSTDTSIAFTSSEPDPANPGHTLPMSHTVTVAAQDNEGGRDATPATRTFSAINQIPNITALVSDFRDSASVGAGFTFEVTAEDSNFSGLEYRVTVDGNQVGNEWDPRAVFRFLDISDNSIVNSLDLGTVRPLSNAQLTPGWHTLGVEARDLGGAISNQRLRRVMVMDTVRPRISSVKALYGTSDYYPDGSTFFRQNTVTSFTMTGTGASYFGNVQAYRYRMATPTNSNPAWSAWGLNSVTFENLPLGDYTFQSQCRDFTGALSDTADYNIRIVQIDFSADKMLIVNETRIGNGNPGSPSKEQVDQFYLDITSGLVAQGWQVDTVSHGEPSNDIGTISPGHVFDKKVLLWHADDFAQIYLDNNLTILREYLDAGGNLILCGWDILSPFSTEDSVTFTSGFAYKYLRIETAVRNGDRDFVGMIGISDLGYDDLIINQSKIPGSWDGLPKGWSLIPRHRTEGIGTWYAADETSEFEGKNCAIRNFSPANNWRAITLGFPLYYTEEAGATAFIETAVMQLTQ